MLIGGLISGSGVWVKLWLVWFAISGSSMNVC
jgi:hypothetical protein